MTESNGKKFQNNNDNGKDTLLINPNATPPKAEEEEKKAIDLDLSKFEQSVVLKQSPKWVRWTTLTIIGVTVFAVGWAYFAKIEQVVQARGQLKPKGTVKEIQAPINGVVKQVEVKDGDYVEKDQTILIFDSESTEAELEALEKIKKSYLQENKFYRILMNSPLTGSMLERAINDLNLPLEVQALAINRNALAEEKRFFLTQLNGGQNFIPLKPEQDARIAAADADLKTRAAVAALEIQQLEKQLNQVQVQLNDLKSQVENDRQVLAEIKQRNELSVVQTEESLRIEQEILDSILPLAEEGALARIQIDRQRQEVKDRYSQLVQQKANGNIEYKNQEQQIISRLAEMERLKEEKDRIFFDITQGEQELKNVFVSSERDLRERMADNDKRISEIDSQINKIIVENEKRIAETDSQIRATKQTIKYQELKSPVSGTVFDLQAGPGYVPKSGQSEALLKIVPEGGKDNPFIAEVYVTNEDIGFVQKDQITDVRIDSFPYSEFGDIKGKVYFVGSDALEPDQVYNFYRFPIKVELDEQFLMINGKKEVLQSGMSVTVNVKINENRTVLSLFTEKFQSKIDSFKQNR